MWDSIPRKVLVGVETASCSPALRAAAEEATRRGCGVHLLHVLSPVYEGRPSIEELTLIAGELQHAGTAVVQDAAEALRELLPADGAVSTELCHGAVGSSLVGASAHACLLVVQHRDSAHDGRRHLLSVVHSVAAHARCPVLVVSETWSGRGASPALVVAGVQDVRQSARVVEAALDEAERRGARLRLVHGVVEPDAGDMDAATHGAWLRRLHHALEADFADLCHRPGVEVELEVVPDPPARALMARSGDADVIVVGRGRARLPFLPRPGPVTSELLRRCTVPVLVVDTAPPGEPPQLRELSEVAIP